MQCPHCSVAFREQWYSDSMRYPDGVASNWSCITTVCPGCDKPCIQIKERISTGNAAIDTVGRLLASAQWVYPNSRRRQSFGEEVPDNLKNDYYEACDIVLLSPRSSATLCRRVLETMLREQGYQQDDLYAQIQAVRVEEDPDKRLSAVLLETIDAVRQFGNFSAHEKKDATGLRIVDVEPEEAAICLGIVEGLFERYYVRPAVEVKRRKAINEKLKQAGKKPL